MNTNEAGARDANLRSTLVGLANAATLDARPRRTRTAAIGIAVFALTGALTGGAVSTIAFAQSESREGELSAQIMGEQMVGTHTPLFGDAFLVTSSGGTEINLGQAPEGAGQVAVSAHCNDRGRFTLMLDGVEQMTLICENESDTAPGHGMGGSILTVTGPGPHTLSVKAADGASSSVWASWAQQPETPPASAAQLQELVDGAVTADEYRNAFHRFADCMAAAGYPVLFIDESQPVFNYSTSNGAYLAGVDSLCYEREFIDVDMAWQLSQEGK